MFCYIFHHISAQPYGLVAKMFVDISLQESNLITVSSVLVTDIYRMLKMKNGIFIEYFIDTF